MPRNGNPYHNLFDDPSNYDTHGADLPVNEGQFPDHWKKRRRRHPDEA